MSVQPFSINIAQATQMINTSMLAYFEASWQELERLPDVLAAFAFFPNDLNPPPREWVERRLHLVHWAPMPHGGHFAAMEEPELLAEDLRVFFRSRRESARARG